MFNRCHLITGVNVNGRTHFGRTALHAAVCKDRIQIVNMLLDAGAAVHMYDVYSQSPVDMAKSHNSFQCEKRLRLMQLNLRGQKDSHCNPNSFSKQRVLSTSHLHSPSKSEIRKNIKPKATSAGAKWRPIHTSNQEPPSKLLSARSDKNNNTIKSNTESYWVVTQTSAIPREIESSLEKKYRNFLDNHDKLIHNKQLPSNSGKTRILKFKKDSSEIIVAKSSLEDLKQKQETVAKTSLEDLKQKQDTARIGSRERLGETENDGDKDNDFPISLHGSKEHVNPVIRKSSIKYGSPASPKSVRFSAKARYIYVLNFFKYSLIKFQFFFW